MAQPQISWLKYDWYKLGNVSINGCKLGYTSIGDDGVYYLSQTKWTSATLVILSILFIVKLEIISEMKDVYALRKHSGQI